MAKMGAAVKQHSAKGLLYISVVTTPTLGGASTSFRVISRQYNRGKRCYIWILGRRIIDDTTYEQLPEDFQTAEYAKRYGMVDIVADKSEIKQIISKLLQLHKR